MFLKKTLVSLNVNGWLCHLNNMKMRQCANYKDLNK